MLLSMSLENFVIDHANSKFINSIVIEPKMLAAYQEEEN